MCFIAARHLKLAIYLSTTIMLASGTIQAQVGNSSAAGTSRYKNPVSKKADSSDWMASFNVELKAISYAESSLADSNSQQQFQTEMNIRKQGRFFTETNFLLGTFSEPNSVYYALPQAFVGYGSPESNIVVGRKKENLSHVDSTFNLGLLQSSFSNDYINFIEGGLTGVRALYSTGNIGFMAGFMPIFIPNQIPQTKVEDGRAVSPNRWSTPSPSKFQTGDDQRDINYAMREYNLFDIISNSGYLLHAYYGENKLRPLLAATFAKKPINEIALSRDTFQDISTSEGFVYLTPVVLTHEIQALDINLDYENINTTVSFLADQPQNVPAKSPDVMQNLSPLNIISFYASIDLGEVMTRKLKIYTAIASISGGEVRDLNSENKESGVTVVNSRTQFKKPIRFGVNGETFFVRSTPIETDFSLTYDQEFKGSLLTMVFKYSVLKNLKLSMGADLIGTESELPPGVSPNFLDRHKADDRFFAGLNYAF